MDPERQAIVEVFTLVSCGIGLFIGGVVGLLVGLQTFLGSGVAVSFIGIFAVSIGGGVAGLIIMLLLVEIVLRVMLTEKEREYIHEH